MAYQKIGLYTVFEAHEKLLFSHPLLLLRSLNDVYRTSYCYLSIMDGEYSLFEYSSEYSSVEALIYLFLSLVLALGTIFYLYRFHVVKIIKIQGVRGLYSNSRILHLIVGALLIFLNVNVWYHLSKGMLQNVSTLSSDIHKSPLTLSILKSKFTEFQVPGYSFIEENIQFNSTENFECGAIQFNDHMSASEAAPVPGDLKRVRDEAFELSQLDYPIAKNCFLDNEGESEEDIINSKWARFCGSSVWLAKHKVHFFVNRIVYAHERERSKPTISLIEVQIFDREWNELKDYKITLANGDELSFPRIMKIDIDQNPKKKLSVMGAEDPRVVLRKFTNDKGEPDEEPVIIFNMRRTEIRWFRAMHFYRPFSSKDTIRLSIRDMKPRFREKNWAPFFDESDPESIYFIYNFNPLRVLKCGLLDGVCDKITGPSFVDNKASESKHVGALRGGTNLVPIPSHLLPLHLQSRKFWFGIARSHNAECGCLKEIYRPHAFIVSKDLDSGEFTFDYVSSLIDFNINAEAWNPSNSVCKDGKNVLIPNSIAYWEQIVKSDSTVDYDFMGVTFSEADRTNKIVHVKGFWHHILQALNNKAMTESTDPLARMEDFFSGNYTELKNELLGKCATTLAGKYCQDTAKLKNWKQF